jgi:hypothetical protein
MKEYIENSDIKPMVADDTTRRELIDHVQRSVSNFTIFFLLITRGTPLSKSFMIN